MACTDRLSNHVGRRILRGPGERDVPVTYPVGYDLGRPVPRRWQVRLVIGLV